MLQVSGGGHYTLTLVVTQIMVMTTGPPRRAWRPGSKSRRDAAEAESSSLVFLSHGEASRARELRDLVRKSYRLIDETDRYISPLFSNAMSRDISEYEEHDGRASTMEKSLSVWDRLSDPNNRKTRKDDVFVQIAREIPALSKVRVLTFLALFSIRCMRCGKNRIGREEAVTRMYETVRTSHRTCLTLERQDKQEKIQVDVPAQLAISCPEIRNRVLANVEYFERKLAALEHAISRKTKTSQTSESDRQAEATDGRKWLRAAEKESSLARPLDFWTVKLEEARKEACTLQGDINGLLGDVSSPFLLLLPLVAAASPILSSPLPPLRLLNSPTGSHANREAARGADDQPEEILRESKHEEGDGPQRWSAAQTLLSHPP
eukprot:753682-Hanusia_phi.AAC.4